MNSIDYFDRGWRQNPMAPCMVEGETGKAHSYDEIRQATLKIADTLRQRGYDIGSKAAVLGYNTVQTFTVVLSILRAGVTWLPINPRNGLVDNVQILNRFDCEILFYLSSFANDIPSILAAAPGIRECLCIDQPGPDKIGLAEWSAMGQTLENPRQHNPEHVYAIQPTGGTTGVPKGVMLSERSLETCMANFMAVTPCLERPIFLAVAPLTHAAGQVFQYLLAQGGCGVLYAKVDRQQILAAIGYYRITHLFLPPTLIYELLAQPGVRDYDYSSLRYFIYGASPMAPEKLQEAIEVFGPVMCQIYGQTEGGVPTTFLAPDDHFDNGQIASHQRLSSCGRATPFARMGVVDTNGNLLGNHQTGELVIGGQGLMVGYYKDPETTAEVLRGGWLHTGDIGYRDDAGFYYIVDRLKDIIISGGFNIYSCEVEQALLSHPAVQDCAVVGAPDAKWGEIVIAVVQLKPSQEHITAEVLIAHSRTQLGGMKTPKQIDFIDALPRSAVGKILKREIRARYWNGKDRLVS